MPFHELRDANGKLVARYDAETQTLEIKPKGGTKSTFDLAAVRSGSAAVKAARLPVAKPQRRS